ncbi:putative transcriptional regulator [Desulfocurvibacter africanus PCS]|uniref:Putative transcriptional regulator n=1 Tax=Desulfocurvibacter africanus PCS TaxID=1262666 RepID=M5PU10_DESAF|nr:MerR family transcriptional regulator [Desulfocurvibacter africanus]EMG37554.1 putative transcriptional regulator [Desulfocurvibacter africanus PCS]
MGGSVEEYLLIGDLAKASGIARNTVRRYVKTFPGIFPGKRFGRVTRYPEASVEMLQRIAEFYREGLNAAEVKKRLAKAGPGECEKSAQPGIAPVIESKAALEPAEGAVRDAARNEADERIVELSTELRRLTGELDAVRQEAARLAGQVGQLTRDRLESLERQERLEARLNELEALQGPPAEFLRLPLVFRSEQGEYLGVTDKQSSQHFSLRDFVCIIHKNAGGRTDVDTSWQRSGNAGWRLVIRETASSTGRSKSHYVDVERFATPKGNLVAKLMDLCFDGQTMPPFFVYELFRQIGRDFA